MNLCRLCGEEKSPLDFNIELSDKSHLNWNYHELIEHHTRVTLKVNKLLPQGVCEECRSLVEDFAVFSLKVQEVQNSYNIDEDDLIFTGEHAQLNSIVQIFPEAIIKEPKDSDDSSCNNQDNDHFEEELTFEEIFYDKLHKNADSLLDLHLDVPKIAILEEGKVSESSLLLINSTRWSEMIKNCDISSKSLNELLSHQAFYQNTKIVKFNCKLCICSFNKIYSYINHVMNKHLQLEHLRYCCLICDMMFYSLVPLYHHVKINHPEYSPKIFQCLICGHYCEDLADLKKHKRIHNESENAEEISEISPMITATTMHNEGTLKNDDVYKNEDGTVGNEDQFAKWSDFHINCYICELKNLTPIDYFSHHQNFHIDCLIPGSLQPSFKFSCNKCHQENFSSLASFSSHLISKHELQELSFRCIVCSKMFWNYVAYSQHLKSIHPSFHHFLCTMCGKIYNELSALNRHIKEIHNSGDKEKYLRKRKMKSDESLSEKRMKKSKIMKKESESELNTDSSKSEYENELSWDEVSFINNRKERKSKKHQQKLNENSKRRPNNRHRPEKQTLFGPELDTPEKLYSNEINGKSVFTSTLYLNVSAVCKLNNGEVTEEAAESQGLNSLRWKDLMICAVCKIKFTNINSLTEHIVKNHGSRTRAFGCFNCDINYGALYESSLVNHLVERHYLEHLKFCCLICSKLFYDFLSLVQHYKSHKGKFEILVCFICGFYAKTLDDLKEHKAYHVQMENSKPENQTLCEKVLQKFNEGFESNTLNEDVADFERLPDGTVTIECERRFTIDWNFAQYQCPLCQVTHPNPFELFVHLRLKHPKEQEQIRKIYSCNSCVEKKDFSGMHYFINHASDFHFESLRFTCVVCLKLFWNYIALANHYKNVHPSFTTVYCCHCGKLFHSITSGAIHYKKIMIMLTEEEKRLKKEGKLEAEVTSHICHVCGKSCKNNYTLVKHITTHEEPDPSKMLQCHICSKLFNTKNKLNQHMVGHNNLRKWKCKICEMSFNFKKLLQMHTRAVHENERSFACSFCEKKFFKKYDLTVHVRLHTGDFPYVCPVQECDSKYPAWSNLFKHCQSRHKLDIRSEGYKKLRASEKTQNEDFVSEMNLCRLCGEEKSPLDFHIELEDQVNQTWSYRDLIEYHTRVSLNCYKLLPQSICEECREHVEKFAEFSKKVHEIQNNYDVEHHESQTLKENVEEVNLYDCLDIKHNTDLVVKDSKEEKSRKSPRKRPRNEKQTSLTVESIFNNIVLNAKSFDEKDYQLNENGEILDGSLFSKNLVKWTDFDIKINYDSKNDLTCSICSNSFHEVYKLLNHIVNNHPEAEYLRHSCLFCFRVFFDLKFLFQHFKEYHKDESLNIYQCWTCGDYEKSIQSLQQHANGHLPETNKDSRNSNYLSPSTRSKRKKISVVSINNEQKDFERDFHESESEYYESSSCEDYEKPKGCRQKGEVKLYGRKRKKLTKNLFGKEIDTFEKLFSDEINKTSSNLHLNINYDSLFNEGEIPESYLVKVSEIRWRDLLNCGACKIPFVNINDLLDHSEMKHNSREKLFHCTLCNGEFTGSCESLLINHLVDRHFYEHLKFCCLVCSKLFYDLLSLVKHYKTHNGKFELLVCLICGWYAKSLEDLKDHKVYHMLSEKSENQKLCELVFEKFNSQSEPSISNLCVAEFEKLPDGTVTDECQRRFTLDWSFGSFQCSTCILSFTTPFDLYVHHRLKHSKESDKKIYSCTLCSDKKDYGNIFTFVNHATAKHLDNAKFCCIVCSKIHWNYLTLANHYRNVHSNFPCVFCCHCGKIFMNVTVAASHFKALNLLRTPEERKLLKEGKISEEKNHICHVCARNFKNRGTLLNHVKTHETLEPSDLLQCHICSKFYKNKYKLAQHMVCHEDLRSWKCKVCGLAFNYKKLMLRHIQAVHENERPFGCTFCEKRFNSKYDLTVHVRLHTGEYPYECPVQDCVAKYPAWSNLFKH
ncbi:CLUMA_CG018952, isoform B [Clunio marinus]|uniref:CLUMA_CG018952, isoform B n=1 Tax=Clunio marinus TaxID=568069 RepID=A0A1J1J0S5_9DIPT|nr:CLUMA_CG018952, isoform B [Clunio marinus]